MDFTQHIRLIACESTPGANTLDTSLSHDVDQTSEELLWNGLPLCHKKLTHNMKVGRRGMVISNVPA